MLESAAITMSPFFDWVKDLCRILCIEFQKKFKQKPPFTYYIVQYTNPKEILCSPWQSANEIDFMASIPKENLVKKIAINIICGNSA